jgi:DNA modification methylase
MNYQQFLESKATIAKSCGFVPESAPASILKPHQNDICEWAIRKGRAAIFASFGTGKGSMQLQLSKWVHEHTGKPVLIVCPLGVKQEFARDARDLLQIRVEYCRTDAEVAAALERTPFVITNYERVRDGNLSVAGFAGICLDEASILRHLGSKTYQTFSSICADIPYRFVATATPAPNDFLSLANYADFLGVLDRGQILTRFFKRDSKQAGNLTIYPHMEREFWLWVASWALFVGKPSDLNPDYSDEGYDLPKIQVHWHRLEVDHSELREADNKGQIKLLADKAGGLKKTAAESRESLQARIEKAIELVRAEPERHCIIWHELEDERRLIEKLLPESMSVYGSQDLDEREERIIGFSNGAFPFLAVKPSIAGSGCNFQRHCSKAVFVGPSYKFNDVIQAIHRIHRFLQPEQVDIHFVFTELQDDVVTVMQRKWRQHDELVTRMRSIVKEYGLSSEALKMELTRDMGQNRAEVNGRDFTLVLNDCTVETKKMAENSVDEIVTSIPFSKSKTGFYEYSANYADFGYNPGSEPFFEQMDYLIPELYRVLKPGRIAAIHTKDSVEYGNMSGLGMYSVYPFSDDCIRAFVKHGFVFMGRICIDTDVVRENAQTYRLGWSENAKDSTKMGVGSPEYVLLFRKWSPEMSPNGTAIGPEPVVKDNSEYTRGKWQIQACFVWKDLGQRLLDPDTVKGLTNQQALALWKQHSAKHGYDYHEHLAITEAADANGDLPSSFMLFAPQSSNPNIWTDIVRMRTLNTEQVRRGEEAHLCPLQIDVVERLIERFSNPGDLIYDPFMGIGTVPYMAVKMNRRGLGCELNPRYWEYAVGHCESLENDAKTVTLFDWFEMEQQQEVKL